MSPFPRCPRCKDHFGWKATGVDEKAPKLLGCGHVVCLSCIKGSPSIIICPVCKKSELKKRDLGEMRYDIHTIGQCVFNSLEKIRLYRKEAYCKPKTKTKAQATKAKCSECNEEDGTVYCRNCEVTLCDTCSFNIHSSSNILRKHKIATLNDSFTPPSDLSKYVRAAVILCTQHKNVVSSYCHDDHLYICSLCSSSGDHHDHRLVPIKQFMNERLEDIKVQFTEAGLVLAFTKKSEKLLRGEMARLVSDKAEVVKKVNKSFNYLHSLLQCREAEMLEKLEGEYSEKLDNISAQVDLYKTQIQNIQTLFQEFGEVLSKESSEMLDVEYVGELLSKIKTLPCYLDGLMQEEDRAGKEGDKGDKEGSDGDKEIKESDKGIKDDGEGKRVDGDAEKKKDWAEEVVGVDGLEEDGGKGEDFEGGIKEDGLKNGSKMSDEGGDLPSGVYHLNHPHKHKHPLITPEQEEELKGMVETLVGRLVSRPPPSTTPCIIGTTFQELPEAVKTQGFSQAFNGNLDLQGILSGCAPGPSAQAPPSSTTTAVKSILKKPANNSYNPTNKHLYNNNNNKLMTKSYNASINNGHNNLTNNYNSALNAHANYANYHPPTARGNHPNHYINNYQNNFPNNQNNYHPPNNHYNPFKPNNNNNPAIPQKPTDNHNNKRSTLKDKRRNDKGIKRVEKPAALPDKMAVRVSHVTTPTSFFVQSLQNCKRLKVIEEEVEKLCVCDKVDKLPLPPYLQQEVVVFAQSPVDGRWRRAKVERKVEGVGKEVRLFFLDHGYSESVDVENIRIAPSKFQKLPALSLWCGLADLTHQGHTWVDGAVEVFKAITNDKCFTMKVYEGRVDRRANTVDLVDLDTTEDMLSGGVASVRDSLIFLGLATFSSQRHYPFYNLNQDKAQEQLPTATCLPIPHTSTTFNISHIQSPTIFFVQHVSRELVRLQRLMDVMDDFYNSDKGGLYAIACPVVGSLCACQSSKDRLWYRARVLDLVPPGSVKVSLLDVGCIETVSVWTLKKLRRQFARLSAQAMECRLMSDVQGGEEVQMEQLKAWKDQGHVEFYVHDLQERLLVLTYVRSLGTTLLPTFEGLDLDDSSQDANQDNNNHHYHQQRSPPQSSTPHHLLPHHSPQAASIAILNTEITANNSTDPDNPACALLDYPSNRPLFNSPVLFCLTHIDRRGIIYCQNAEPANAASLNSMMVKLDQQSRLSRAYYNVEWKAGDIACCKYNRDNFFYRVKVLTADAIYHTAKVLFVDYGNEEDVVFDELRPALFIDHPVSCYAVTLNGVEWVKDCRDGLVSDVIVKEVMMMIHNLSNNQLSAFIKSDVMRSPRDLVADMMLLDGSSLTSHLLLRKFVVVHKSGS